MGDLTERLIIRVDSSTQIGTGHLMRSLALGQAWKDTGGHVVFISACQSESLLQRLREEEFAIHLLANPYPDRSDWDYTKDILAAHPNAWVVLDGYHFNEVYQQRVKEADHQLLIIDDTAHLKHYYSDIVLNQNLHAKQLSYPCEPYTRLLLGTRYVLLRREFLAWRGWKREVPDVARRVLVTLGGGDPKNYTLKVVQALQQVNLPFLEVTVISGASNPHANMLQAEIAQSFVPIRLIHDVRNMPKLMAWADVAISSGGSTCWELSFMGLPSIILVLSENQYVIAKELETAGVVLNLGWGVGVDSVDISKALSKLAQMKETRREMSWLGQKLVDGFGGQRVSELLQEKKEGS